MIDGRSETAINKAARRGRWEVVRILVGGERKARVDFQNQDRRTALYYAIRSRNRRNVLRVLTGANARQAIETRDDRGRLPLHQAAANGDIDIINLLFEHGAKKNELDPWRHTAEQVAWNNGNAQASNLIRNHPEWAYI